MSDTQDLDRSLLQEATGAFDADIGVTHRWCLSMKEISRQFKIPLVEAEPVNPQVNTVEGSWWC